MIEALEITNVTNDMILEWENENLDLKDYANDLNVAACKKSSQVFANHDNDYAAIALAILFEKTKSRFCLIVDSFKGHISNNKYYIAALDDCLKKGRKAEVLTLHTPNEKSKGFQLLKEYKEKNKEQVKIRIATQESKEAIERSMKKGLLNFNELHNIGVFDDDKYRLEYKPSEFKAFVSMHNTKIAAVHQKTFDEAFSHGKDYQTQIQVSA